MRELISHQFVEECPAVLEYTPAAVTVLLTSCAAQVLGLHCWPEEKSLAMLGASSFDVVRLLAVVEDRLGMGGEREAVLSSLFELLLAEPLQSVVSAVVKLLLRSRGEERDMEGGHSTLKQGTVTGKKRSADVAGVPEAVPHSKHIVERSPCSRSQVDLKCWRRGQILINGRSANISAVHYYHTHTILPIYML